MILFQDIYMRVTNSI